MKYVLALIASIFLFNPILSLAESQTTITTASGLSEQQKADLAAQAAKMVADNANGAVNPVTKAKEFQQWIDLGQAIGSGLASTAKELGIAANDFVKTPVGKLTAALIVWHFIGSSIIHLTFGISWLFVVGTVLFLMYRRAAYETTVTEYEAGKGPNGAKKVTKRVVNRLTDGQNGFFIVASLLTVAIGVISVATF